MPALATPSRVVRLAPRTPGGPAYEKVATPLGRYYRSDAPRAALLKAAAAGQNDDGDGGFERSFSSLAYSYLKEKSPKLLDHVVGFQLIDRNEDSTKALGAFGIRLGSQWIYAPAFFLNGELKGHEMVWLAKPGVFVPNKESWVNYLLGRRPHVLGEESPEDAYGLGGLSPEVARLSTVPSFGKYGGDRWALPFLPVYAAAAVDGGRPLLAKCGSDGAALDLRSRLGSDLRFAAALLGMAEAYPGVKAALDRFYGPALFKEAALSLASRAVAPFRALPEPPPSRPASPVPPSAAEREKAAAEAEAGKLEVYEGDDAPGLGDGDRRELLLNGVLVKDRRSAGAASEVYDASTSVSLANPGATGLYDVLERPGKFGRMLAVHAPYAQSGRRDFVTLVRLSGRKAWGNFGAGGVWCRAAAPDSEYRDWWEGLAEGGPSEGKTYVAVGPTGEGTAPFRVRRGAGEGAWRVDFELGEGGDADEPGRVFMVDRLPQRDAESESRDPGPYDALLRVNARPGSRLRSLGGELLVPGGFKFVEVRGSSWPDGPDHASADDEPVQPGRLDDLQLRFAEKTAALAVRQSGGVYAVETAAGVREARHAGALASLVRDHGLAEKAAREVLAAAVPGATARFRVKYAYPFPRGGGRLDGGPDAPPLPPPYTGVEYNGPNAVPANYPQEHRVTVPGVGAEWTNGAVYDPWRNYTYDQDREASRAQAAAATGEKELFDVSALAALTKSVGADAHGEGDLATFMKAVDKLGTRLFLLYWHSEDYEERYGKADMPELEDSLRNAFQVLGDVVLFLKQKTVTPLFEGLGDPDIGDAARN